MENIKFTARVEYSNGRSTSDSNGFVCQSFADEAAADAWAKDLLCKDPGAIVTVWKAFTADVHCVYHGQ